MSTTPKAKDRDYWKTGVSRADRKARKQQYKRGTASDVAAHKAKVSAYKASKRKVKPTRTKTVKSKGTSKTLLNQFYDWLTPEDKMLATKLEKIHKFRERHFNKIIRKQKYKKLYFSNPTI